MRAHDQFSGWTDVLTEDPPADDSYRAGLWLMARHPRLARLAARIAGVVEVEDDGPRVDLHHLTEVVAAEPRYADAWREYERCHPPPKDDDGWERWRAAGPQPDEFERGLSDFLVMSSGEIVTVRLLAAFGGEVPLRTGDLSSLDAEGARLLADWCRALQVACAGAPGPLRAERVHRPADVAPADSIAYWPVESTDLSR